MNLKHEYHNYSIPELWDETLNGQKFNAVFYATYLVAKKDLKNSGLYQYCLFYYII